MPLFEEGGAKNVANPENRPSKADVQSTELNKMPPTALVDTEFSAEEAAEVFQEKQTDRVAPNAQE